jgi:REP element-mobilizing transposase RayT
MNISLDEFVIMPDHFHAIIIIGKNPYNQIKSSGNNRRRNAMHGVSTNMVDDSTTRVGISTITTNDYINTYGPQSKNLSSIIRGIKSAVTMYAKKMKLDFSWQPRYHDDIIRTNRELNRIRKYIIENPGNWISDSVDFNKVK